jgi:Sap, sulfolipid-1-addressing protein
MNAEFFALAFSAALNPKLLAVDLLLIENRRPRAMFSCVLLGGMTVALTIGLLDVLTVHADAITAQAKASAGVDLAIGLLLLAAGGLLAAGRLHGRQRTPVPAGTMPPEQPEQPEQPERPEQPEKPEKKDKKDNWAARMLAEPRLGLAMLAGALIGLPGASYLTALRHLITGKYSTSTQVIAVVVFVVIEFLLIIIPFAFLELRPEATKALLRRSQDWLLRHALQLMVGIALLLGGYLTVSGLIRLS